MQTILDLPMVAQHGAEVLRPRLLAGDEVPHFRSRLPLERPLAVADADGLQPLPLPAGAQPLGPVQHRVAAVLLPAVAALPLLPAVMLHLRQARRERLLESASDVLQQMLLILLDRQHVVGALLNDP